MCVLYLRVRHDAWVNRDVRFVSACQSRCACVPLSASESRCAAVSACHSRCACFCCLLVSPAVGVVCWLRARHHVRVLCLRVNHDVRLFLSARGSVRQSLRSSANTNVNHLRNAMVDIVLG